MRSIKAPGCCQTLPMALATFLSEDAQPANNYVIDLRIITQHRLTIHYLIIASNISIRGKTSVLETCGRSIARSLRPTCHGDIKQERAHAAIFSFFLLVSTMGKIGNAQFHGLCFTTLRNEWQFPHITFIPFMHA